MKYSKLKRQLDQIENNSQKSQFDDALYLCLAKEIVTFLKDTRQMNEELFGSPDIDGLSEEDALMSTNQWEIRLKEMSLSPQLKERILANYKVRKFDYVTLNWLCVEPELEELSNQKLDEKIKEIEAWFELNT